MVIRVINFSGDILWVKSLKQRRWGGCALVVATRDQAKQFPTRADAELAIQRIQGDPRHKKLDEALLRIHGRSTSFAIEE